MSIYITGDIHGYPIRLSAEQLHKRGVVFAETDKLIVCGDFGLPWYNDKEELQCIEWLARMPFEILFIDGNHENFDLLNALPVEERYSGKVHKLHDNIYHLMRGEVYEIEGKTFFTFGGATSFDKYYREEGVSWWREETHTQEEYENALKNLTKVDFSVDYVITHTAPKNFLENVDFNKQGAEECPVAIMLDDLRKRLSCCKWFVGHFHIDTLDETTKVVWMYDELKKV